jgi:hypothetical protein
MDEYETQQLVDANKRITVAGESEATATNNNSFS